jgi:NADH:ubiquinone oxidoreductase subunit C
MLDHREFGPALQNVLARFSCEVVETSLKEGWIVSVPAKDWYSVIHALYFDGQLNLRKLLIYLRRQLGTQSELILELEPLSGHERVSIRTKLVPGQKLESLGDLWVMATYHENEFYAKGGTQ